MKYKAFTLIELLIVVAIIAILAAIAVPNFLEAQTRAKVSRVKADIRSFATGMESYAVDNNGYPNCHRFGVVTRTAAADPEILERLSTPVAYLTNVLTRDPFKVQKRFQSANAAAMKTEVPTVLTDADLVFKLNSYVYQSWNGSQRYTQPPDGFSDAAKSTKSTAWILHSCGPDGNYYNLGGVLANDGPDKLVDTVDLIYDPTNGTVSRGSIWRSGGAGSGGGTYAGGTGLLAAINTQR